MRVLILTFTYAPNMDGVAVASTRMAEGLAAMGHQVSVATGYSPNSDTTSVGDISVFRFDVSGASNWRIGITGQIDEYKEFVAAFPADVIICHSWPMWATDLAIQVFDRTRAKKILVSHGFSVHEIPWRSKFPFGLLFWAGWLPCMLRMPWQLFKFDAVTFLSAKRGFGRFIDHTFAALLRHPKIAVIPNGVSLDEFTDRAVDFRSSYDIVGRFLVLNVANYFPTKNQEEVLRAFRYSNIAGSTLVFIGSTFNDHSAYLLELDRELRVSYPEGKVVFLEKIPRRVICAAYQQADLFVTASRFETQPIVLLEAMSAKLPFIARDVGCVRDFPGGIILSDGDDLCESIKNAYADEEMRRRLGQAGREAVEETYSHERVIEKFDRLITSIT